MSLGIQHSTYPLPRQAWPRTLAALKLAVAMLLPDGSASAQARKDYAQTPTPKAVARRMLEIGGAGPNDLVADLGSGDGRIPILAAQVFGARAIGVELDQALHAAALANVQRTGTSERVTLIHGDLFETRLADVTLLTLYLPPSLTCGCAGASWVRCSRAHASSRTSSGWAPGCRIARRGRRAAQSCCGWCRQASTGGGDWKRTVRSLISTSARHSRRWLAQLW
jgi:SAM-dependent methyltransferase